MSFYTSLTGLNAATAQLSVTSNNIANVGTTGFKRSRVDFGDIFATSPLQRAASVIGQGVAIKSVTQEFSQGNLSFSANSLNMGISGDGFFYMKSADGLQDVYTRSGEFVLNEDYAVVNASKQSLMAAAVDDAGKADLSKLSKLVIPRATIGDARETTEVNLGLNLPADAAVIKAPFNPADSSTYNLTTGVTVFDEAGNGYLATVYYVKTQNATTTDPTNKWQTHVFIGDTKLEEKLIQATDTNGAKLFVNQYGETRSFATGTEPPVYEGTPLYYLDSLNDRIDSTPATAKGDALTLTKITNWQTGYATDKLQDVVSKMGFTAPSTPPTLGSGTSMKMTVTSGSTSYTFTATAPADFESGLASIADQINKDTTNNVNFTASINANGQLQITADTANTALPTISLATIDSSNASTSVSADPTLTHYAQAGFTVNKTTALLGNDTQLSLAISGVDTDLTFTANSTDTYADGLADIATRINSASGLSFTATIDSEGQLRISAKTEGTSLPTFTFTKTLSSGVITTISANPALAQAAQNGPSFYLNVDGSKEPILVDLSSLTASDTAITGADMAREITKLINKQYGDERYFDFSNYLSNDGSSVSLFQIALTTNEESAAQNDFKMISFEVGAGENISQMTVEDAVSRIQDAVRAVKPSITVGYDAVNKSFTFKDASDTNRVHLRSAGGLATDAFFGIGGTQYTTADPTTGLYGAYTIPNGDMMREQSDQRYGIKVSFGDEGFSISSGSTGDDSSISIFGASDMAKELFGFSSSVTSADGNYVSAALNPARGISSDPATLVGNTIGVNLNNKFRVDSTNNTFVVSVDNVSGTVQVPAKDDYTIYSFAAELERRINAMVDSEGRTVNGVKVNVEQTGNGTGYLTFKTGTTGNNAFMRVSGDSVWGLSDIGSARGSTSLWVPNIETLQATNAGNSLLYVAAEDDNNFSESTQASNDTLPDWVPVFLDKGELTFDSRGNLYSPTVATRLVQPSGSAYNLSFSMNYEGSTQYASSFSILSQDQNGKPEGDLIGLDVGNDGLVLASYSNGSQKKLAKVVLANFSAPTGLRQIGDSNYVATAQSGALALGEASSAGFGTVRAGATERANVDLTTELIELITAQRNFQANAKAIETNNTLTQTMINIRS
ncbi:MAG: Flagellar hook protein FlgE [Pseudomonadota bacterium]|jgi:flagellar hook-basal body protein